MPKQKDLKRRVRERMKKTGESYTAARAQLLDKKTSLPANYAELGGMKDAVLRAKTGKTWKHWVRVLDEHHGTKLTHRELATLLYEEYRVPGWWAQMVTVGYERIRGLREPGQRRDGSYEVSKSKTVGVPLTTLYAAWEDEATRTVWLPNPIAIRKATRNKSMRITWPDGTTVAVDFSAKGRDKSQVALGHLKLPNKAAATEMKQYWAARLTALAELLGVGSPRAGS